VPRLSQRRRVQRRRQAERERRHVRHRTGGGGEGGDGAEAPAAAGAQEGRRHLLRRFLRPPGRRRIFRRGNAPLLYSRWSFPERTVRHAVPRIRVPLGTMRERVVACERLRSWCVSLRTPVEHLVATGWCSGQTRGSRLLRSAMLQLCNLGIGRAASDFLASLGRHRARRWASCGFHCSCTVSVRNAFVKC
jgi:hypothetical protein